MLTSPSYFQRTVSKDHNIVCDDKAVKDGITVPFCSNISGSHWLSINQKYHTHLKEKISTSFPFIEWQMPKNIQVQKDELLVYSC